MLRKTVVFFISLSLYTGLSFGADPFDKFKEQIQGQVKAIAEERLDSFAKDLGALLGGGAFHQGKTLGVPGFDVGIHIPAKKVNNDNVIMEAGDIDTVLLPIVQAEIGLPSKIDLIARFTSYSDATMIGVGARYGIIKSGIPGMPAISVQAVYNQLNVSAGDNKFSANTISVAGVVSLNLPVVTPYAGLGFDTTKVTPDSDITDAEGSASGIRLEGGVNLSLVPLTYLQLGASLVNSDMGYTLGLGVKF